MRSRRLVVMARILSVAAISVGGFWVLQEPSREFESRSAVAGLRLLGVDNVHVSGTSIQVVPQGHPAFRALVTPSCSSIASILAIGCLAGLSPRRSAARRGMAVAVAGATVLVGNIVRIAASVAVGLVAGRSSLVLFHDWVGSIFGFAYVLGGYVFLLYLLLSSKPQERSLCLPPSRSSPAPLAVASS